MNFGLEIKIEKIYIEKLNSEKNVIMIIFNFKDNNSNKEWKVEKTYDVLINFLSTILYFFKLEKMPLIENMNENNFNIFLIDLEKYLNNIFNLPEIYNFEQIRMFFEFNLNINNNSKNTFINLFNINNKNKNKEINIKKIKIFENKLFIHYDFDNENNNNFFNIFSSTSSKSIFEILEINKIINYNEFNYNKIYSNEFDNKIQKFFIQNKNYVIICFENGKIIILKENKIFYYCNYNKNIKKIFFNEIKGYLYILSYNSKNIDIIEINYNKLIEKIFLSKNSIEKIIFNENNLIFLLSNNFLYCYNLEKKLFINSIFLEFQIKNFFIVNNYNENTIVFYNNNNEIYFYNFINEKFIFKRKINYNNININFNKIFFIEKNLFVIYKNFLKILNHNFEENEFCLNFNLEKDSKIFYNNNYENIFGIYDKKIIKIYKFTNYFYSEENRINKEINNYYFYDEIFNLNDINNKTNNNLKGNILKIKKFFSNQNIKENDNNLNQEKNIEKINNEEQNSESTKLNENYDSENENSLDGWEEEIPKIINRINNISKINVDFNVNNINFNNDINEPENNSRNSFNSYSYRSNDIFSNIKNIFNFSRENSFSY